MCWTRDLAALILAAGLMAGCQHSKRPFADVADPAEGPTVPAATLPAPEAVALAPQPEPVVTPPAPPAQPVETQAPATAPVTTRAAGVLQRDWPVTVTYLPSGDVVAYPNYWPNLEKASLRSNWENAVYEPLEFLANSALLPFRAVLTSPWTPVINSPEGPAGEEHLLIGQPWLNH